MRLAAACFALAGTVLALAGHLSAAERVKVIALGWDRPSVELLARNYREMEKQPFDGTAFEVAVGSGRNRLSMRTAFSGSAWNRSWFAGLAEQLRACDFRTLTDNFVLIGANPGDVDWFDDKGWEQVVDHWRTAAWFARQGKAKGIMFDPEAHTPPHLQFSYRRQAQSAAHSFAEYREKARWRGRQVIKAVVEEYPDITLLCLFLDSANWAAANSDDPEAALAGQEYGLYPAFIDGWLDAITPEARIVDGCSAAYQYNSENEYLDAAAAIRVACQRLVSEPNRQRYRGQVQVGFGFYMDAYINPPRSQYHIDPQGGSPLQRFQMNLSTAARVTDEYVWIHGEARRWWPRTTALPEDGYWRDAIPGSEAVLRLVRDPIGHARAAIAEERAFPQQKNLAVNGAFSARPGTQPATDVSETVPGWQPWQQQNSAGLIALDGEKGAAERGSVKITGAGHACVSQSYVVHPGELYAVSGMCRASGAGEALIRIRWKTDDGRWTAGARESIISGLQSSDQWRELSGVVEVPASAGRMQVQLTARDQASPDDSAWFDDVVVLRIR